MHEKQSNPWMYVSIFIGILLVISMGQNFLTATSGRVAAPSPSPSPTPPPIAPAAPSPPARVTEFSIPDYLPAQNGEGAAVNFIEFADYQCPFCERFHSQSYPSLKTDYIDTKKINFYFADFAFLGPDSSTLSEGAWCANDQGKYYAYSNYVFENQGVEHSGWGTPDKVKEMVKKISGINAATFAECIDTGKYTARVTELTALGQSAGVSGTPSFLIGNDANGYQLVVGAVPYDQIKAAVEAELAQ